jgi:2-keto-3-deoxy-L-rhamnonate aldolase RhmA
VTQTFISFQRTDHPLHYQEEQRMAKTQTAQRSTGHDPTALGRRFKRRLKKQELLLGGTAAEYLRPSLAKIYARAGYDFVFIDKEHMFFDGAEMTDFVLSARDNGLPVISKVGELNRPEVARLLEAGVTGIQLPRTETRQQVEVLASYMKFPPVGTRAGAPCYGNVDYVWPQDDAAWLKKADQSTVIVAHIETALGYENAEEIITAPHMDMVYVGPYDFSIAMGHPGQYDHPEVTQPMREILRLCRKHGVAFGTTPSGRDAGMQWIKKGCQFFELASEQGLIAAGASQAVNAYRS